MSGVDCSSVHTEYIRALSYLFYNCMTEAIVALQKQKNGYVYKCMVECGNTLLVTCTLSHSTPRGTSQGESTTFKKGCLQSDMYTQN